MTTAPPQTSNTYHIPAVSTPTPSARADRPSIPKVSSRLLQAMGSHRVPSRAAMTTWVNRRAALQYGQSGAVSYEARGSFSLPYLQGDSPA